jgi:hypothetical protein
VRVLVVTGLVALIVSASATAFPGVGNGTSASAREAVLTTGVAKKRAKSCQASDRSKGSEPLIGNRHRMAVIACEQPPRMNMASTDQILKAVTAALSILG